MQDMARMWHAVDTVLMVLSVCAQAVQAELKTEYYYLFQPAKAEGLLTTRGFQSLYKRPVSNQFYLDT